MVTPAEICAKRWCGASLNDLELLQGHGHFSKLAEMLAASGPEFAAASEHAAAIAYTLGVYRRAREDAYGMPLEQTKPAGLLERIS